jgi:type II secretory pathway pseudopilin PulG
MLSKPNGFFLVELLLSLSVWIALTLLLLPMFIQVSKQSLDTQYSREATKILYDTLQEHLFTGHTIENSTYVRKGKSFTVSKAITENKVCVTYENSYKKETALCDTLE